MLKPGKLSPTISGLFSKSARVIAELDCDFSGTNLTDDAKQFIASAAWHTSSANTASTSSFTTAQQLYDGERSGNTTVKGCINITYCRGVDDVPRKATWTGKVALLHPSDYVYSISSSLRSQCSSAINTYKQCYGNSYLFEDAFATSQSGISVQLLNPMRSARTNAGVASLVSDDSGFPSISVGYWSFHIYPSVFLDSSVIVIEGKDTATEPYVVQLGN